MCRTATGYVSCIDQIDILKFADSNLCILISRRCQRGISQMHNNAVRMLFADLCEEINVFADIYRRSCRDFFCLIMVFVNFIYADGSVSIGNAIHDDMHGNDFYIVFFYKVFRKIGATFSGNNNLSHFSCIPFLLSAKTTTSSFRY